MIIINYFKKIFGMWSTWVFTGLDVIVFIITVSAKSYVIPVWVFWFVAILGFVVVNIQLYSQMENQLREYEALEANIMIVNNKPTDVSIIGESDLVPDGILKNSGIPPENSVGGMFEVENQGWEDGEFFWEIDEDRSYIPYPFVFHNEDTKRYLKSKAPLIEARTKRKVFWSAKLDVSEKSPDVFAIEMAKPKKYKIQLYYWTSRIGGQSEKNDIVIEGDLETYKNTLVHIWKKSGLDNLVELIGKKW